MAPVKTKTIVERTGFDAQGKVAPSVEVTFTVGDAGPFTVHIPKSEFTAAEAQRRVQEYASHIQQILGLGN
jgi:hypothetical protein